MVFTVHHVTPHRSIRYKKNASIDNRLKLQDLRVNNWSPKPNFFCAVGWLMRNFGGYFFGGGG